MKDNQWPADNAPNAAPECSNGSMKPSEGLTKPLLVLTIKGKVPPEHLKMMAEIMRERAEAIGAESFVMEDDLSLEVVQPLGQLIQAIREQTQAVSELAASCMAMAETVAQAMADDVQEASEDDFPQPMSRKR